MALAFPIMVGCYGPQTVEERSPVLHENGRVTQLTYVPATRSSRISPTLDSNLNVGIGFTAIGGSGLSPAIDSSSNVGVGSSSENGAVYGVTFESPKGRFVSQGTDQRHQDLWKRMKKDVPVEVTYQEVYSVTYQDTDGDRKKEQVGPRRFVRFDFLDAQLK